MSYSIILDELTWADIGNNDPLDWPSVKDGFAGFVTDYSRHVIRVANIGSGDLQPPPTSRKIASFRCFASSRNWGYAGMRAILSLPALCQLCLALRVDRRRQTS